MKQALEFTCFLAAALTVHVAILPDIDVTTSAAQGGGGERSVTLVASVSSLSALVSEWEAPPQVADTVSMRAPTLPDAVPIMNVAQSAPALALPVLPLQTARQEKLPQVDLIVAPPPSRMAPLVSPRPKVRPVRAVRPKQPAAPSRARETASGSGQSTTAGVTQAAPRAATSAPTSRTNTAALSQWGASIRNSIERRKRYPRGTRASGVVKLAISVSTNGTLAGVSVVGSSGDSALDRAALNAVQRARLPVAPNGVLAGQHQFTLPMMFTP